MVISDAEKKILLERLAKAREVKAAKAAASKKVSVPKKETPQTCATPVMEPMPSPDVTLDEVERVEKLPAEMVIALPPKVQKEEKQQKREKIDNSSDESENEESAKPVKKTSKSIRKTKETPYMKLKIYREPKNHAALQNLIEAVQENDDECIEHPPPLTYEAPRLRHDIKNQTPKASKTLPTQQELMRRAALEFFG